MRACVDLGVQEGATLLADGHGHPLADGPGYVLGPSLFDHLRPGMRIHAEEIFGPVLAMIRARDAEDRDFTLARRHPRGRAVLATDDGPGPDARA